MFCCAFRVRVARFVASPSFLPIHRASSSILKYTTNCLKLPKTHYMVTIHLNLPEIYQYVPTLSYFSKALCPRVGAPAYPPPGSPSRGASSPHHPAGPSAASRCRGRGRSAVPPQAAAAWGRTGEWLGERVHDNSDLNDLCARLLNLGRALDVVSRSGRCVERGRTLSAEHGLLHFKSWISTYVDASKY